MEGECVNSVGWGEVWKQRRLYPFGPPNFDTPIFCNFEAAPRPKATAFTKLLTLMKSTIIKREGILMKRTKHKNTLVFIVNTLVLPPALSQNPSSHFSYTKPAIQHYPQHPYHCPYSMPPLPDNQRRFVADEHRGVWMNGGRPPHSGPPFGHEGIYSSHSCG